IFSSPACGGGREGARPHNQCVRWTRAPPASLRSRPPPQARGRENKRKDMRRGLMGWSPDELPQAALDARRMRLQAGLARADLDALVLYTNIVRPSAVCWLTGFTPYWIESLLLLPREGKTLLATALSKRVSDWVRATSRIEDIISTPKPGIAIG